MEWRNEAGRQEEERWSEGGRVGRQGGRRGRDLPMICLGCASVHFLSLFIIRWPGGAYAIKRRLSRAPILQT